MRPFHKLCKTNTRQGNVSACRLASSLQPFPNEIWYKDPHKTARQILDGVDQSIMVRTLLHLPQTDPHQNLRNGLMYEKYTVITVHNPNRWSVEYI
jgi:hypothetical protein